MSHNIADPLVALAHGYLILGVPFAITFVTRGVNRIDPFASVASHKPNSIVADPLDLRNLESLKRRRAQACPP